MKLILKNPSGQDPHLFEITGEHDGDDQNETAIGKVFIGSRTRARAICERYNAYDDVVHLLKVFRKYGNDEHHSTVDLVQNTLIEIERLAEEHGIDELLDE